MTTIGLLGIVKQEGLIIERMFQSLDGVIDDWLLVDTGSDDGTLEYLQERGDGHVEQSEFLDFGHNRNEAFAFAEEKLKTDYWLLFDADLELQILQPLGDLTGDVYQIEHTEQVETGIGYRYWVPRILKAKPGWQWAGRTHEYLRIPEGVPTQNIYEWRIVDHADGASRIVKAERDLHLLMLDWNDTDNRVDKRRTAAYLASTQGMAGNEPECINWLRKRVLMGGEDRELYVYQYQLAGLIRDPVEMMRAWLLSPDRAEPLAWLGQYYASNGDFERVYRVGKLALNIPFPEGSALVSSTVYDYDILFQTAVAAFETGRLDEAVALGRQLLGRNLPAEVRTLAEANQAEFLTAKYPHA